MIARRNVSVCGWSFSSSVEVPHHQKNHHLNSHERDYDHRVVSSGNEMTTPKSAHDVTTPTENVAEFIISDLLRIAVFAKYHPR